MWQEQAARQQRRREEAERDNVCLRLALERQQKAQRLENLIKKRSNQLVKCSVHGRMDVNVVIQANGLARSTISPNDVHMREGVDGKLLEFSFYKLLPYVQAAAESVWQHIKGVEKHLGVGSIYSKTAKNLDEPYTVIKDFSIEIYSNSSRANYKTKPVVGRYVEDDRDIVIWVLHATSVEVKHKLLSEPSTAGQEFIQLQLCSRISLDQDNTKTYCSNACQLSHSSRGENIVTHRKSIEDNLVDRVLGRRLQG
ncbi:hypothetical protein PInf_013119 [Phytophthora infestans]|nr:hypothetical protein PInf_013119 [Phytophthora infestans]